MKRRWDKIVLTFLTGGALLASAYLLWARPAFKNWGASPEEIQSSLPGDKFIPPGSIVTTRALDINASPEKIWPWLIQLGHGRGGFYSYTWLEKIFATDMVNAEEIRPELQLLKVGDPIAWRQSGSKATWTSVVLMDQYKTLVLEQGYTFHLKPLGPDRTRLLVRYVWNQDRPTYYLLMEPTHFVMESGMMLGIKQRAERQVSGSRGQVPANNLNETKGSVQPAVGKSSPSKITGNKP